MSMHIGEVAVYTLKTPEGKELPRVRLTVEGYSFVFGLNQAGRLDCIASEKCHGNIKCRAYAIAAVRLKSFQEGREKTPSVILEEVGGRFEGKVPFGAATYKFLAFWYTGTQICVEIDKHTEAWFAFSQEKNKWEYASAKGYGADRKPLKNAGRIGLKVANAMVAEKISAQLRLLF